MGHGFHGDKKPKLPEIFNTVISCPAAVLDPHVALGWICFEDVPPMFSWSGMIWVDMTIHARNDTTAAYFYGSWHISGVADFLLWEYPGHNLSTGSFVEGILGSHLKKSWEHHEMLNAPVGKSWWPKPIATMEISQFSDRQQIWENT